MAPIKFEENIKDKLDKRTIQPSVKAWDKLSERLNQNEKKGNNKAVWWIGVAASLIGVLFVVSQFFSNTMPEEIVPEIVDTPQVETTIEPTNETKIADEKVTEETKVKDVNYLKNPKLNKAENVIAVTNEIVVKDKKVEIKENEITGFKTEPKKAIAIVKEELTFEEETIRNVVAKIQEMKDGNNDVTEDAIDALLLQAEKEIRLNKLYNENTKVVDADVLLQDVESDLDRSFRIKVFETLKASYNSVKTAVAQRNN